MTEIAYGSYLGHPEPDPEEAVSWAVETKAKMVDLKFCDLLGTWQHVTLPLRALDPDSFREGLGFDGSSIRGWQGIAESDMLLMPDPATAIVDPFASEPTVSFVCEIADPLTLEPYSRDPRRVARRAEAYLLETGIADASHFGPECEFFVFDSVSYSLDVNKAHYHVDSEEGHWNAAEPGLGNAGTQRLSWLLTCKTLAWGACALTAAAAAFFLLPRWLPKAPRHQQLTTRAWDAYNAENYAEAIRAASACVNQFEDTAQDLQEGLRAQNVELPTGLVARAVRDRILRNGPLNDVATVSRASSRLIYRSRVSRRAPGRPPEIASTAWTRNASTV